MQIIQPPVSRYKISGGYIQLNNKINGSVGFVCRVCGERVTFSGAGTKHRNHCPRCLSSVHLDSVPGDRSADCGGIMDPIGIWVRDSGEWAVIHRCRKCGALSSNRIAADDDVFKLLSLAAKPMANPPFPIEYWDKM